MSRDAVVVVVNRLRAEYPRRNPSSPDICRDLALLQSVEIASGTHPASYSLGTGGIACGD